jgi:hypothetical protein
MIIEYIFYFRKLKFLYLHGIYIRNILISYYAGTIIKDDLTNL